MRIITLDDELLISLTHELWLNSTEEFSPDYIIGIERGGGILVDSLVKTNVVMEEKVIKVKLSRSLTKYKSTFFNQMISFFPDCINRVLRVIESRGKELISVFYKANKRYVSLDPSVDLTVLNEKKILIIDDAVDSGATLISCMDFLSEHSVPLDIKVAALTVTFKSPMIEPDFYLYRRTIIRFPWASDVKK